MELKGGEGRGAPGTPEPEAGAGPHPQGHARACLPHMGIQHLGCLCTQVKTEVKMHPLCSHQTLRAPIPCSLLPLDLAPRGALTSVWSWHRVCFSSQGFTWQPLCQTLLTTPAPPQHLPQDSDGLFTRLSSIPDRGLLRDFNDLHLPCQR